MVKLITDYFFLKINRVWFLTNYYNSKEEITNCDIVRLIRYRGTDIKEIGEEQYTIFTELTLDENEILQKMNKNVRYEIRRASKEDLKISIYDYKDLLRDKKILKDFKSTYDSFAEISGQPELKNDFDDRKILSYIENKCIKVSEIVFCNGRVFHMYVYDEDNSCLIYSASDFRNSNVDRNLAGRANKLLHYNDMLHFKSIGVKNYDWGNISSKDNPNGIDIFKMSFGGEIEKIRNIFIPITIKGKIFLRIKKYFNLIRR